MPLAPAAVPANGLVSSMPLKLSDDDVAAIEARIRAFEARTGTEAVTALVGRSDHYHGLRWRAFALGVALAAPAVILADLLRPDWVHARAVLFAIAIGVMTPGVGWFLYVFLIPFWAMFPIIIIGPKATVALLAVYVIGYPIAKLVLRRMPWYQKASLDMKTKGTATVGGMVFTSGGSSSSSSSGSGFSGGGGSSGGGGASGSW